jgi:hypothetical protein
MVKPPSFLIYERVLRLCGQQCVLYELLIFYLCGPLIFYLCVLFSLCVLLIFSLCVLLIFYLCELCVLCVLFLPLFDCNP